MTLQPKRSQYFLLCFTLTICSFVNCSFNIAAARSTNQSKTNQTSMIKEIVDIAALTAEDPQKAVKHIEISKPKKTIKCDIFIAGGGLGGVAAALKIWQLNELNKKSHRHAPNIVLSEETDWLGGQATAQGVSALDENYLVETTGCTANFQKLRHAIRNNYKSNHQLADAALEKKYFNPGNCWVSRLSFEPKVAVTEINTMLAPAIANSSDSSLKVLYRHKVYYAKNKKHLFSRDKTKIKTVYLVNLDTNETLAVQAKLFLDATELGDLLAIANLPYVSGAEAKKDTTEPYALETADNDNVQDFTYPFVLEFRPGENHTINKPALYDELLQQGQFSFDGYKMFAETTRTNPTGEVQQLLPFWTYRRLIDARNFIDLSSNDLSMINWSGNDVRHKNIIDKSASIQAENLAFGKLVSLGFLYWLQTEAPRDDADNTNAGNTKGYPELLLRPDVMGTADGLSKYPYIRESRRAKTKYTVIGPDIAAAFNHGSRAKQFTDSVGIGFYPIDIHGREDIPGTERASKPFQIPLGSLIPEKFAGLLPACKNIGVTHITNGAYRLHPIEWAIGEVQGALSYYAISKNISPTKVFSEKKYLRELQKLLLETGVPIYWFNDLPPEHPAFVAGQFMAVTEIMPGDKNHLHFYPDKLMTKNDATAAINKLLSNTASADNAILAQPLLSAVDQNQISRAQFAIWLYSIAQSKNLLHSRFEK